MIQPCGGEVTRALSYMYDAARRMTREQEVIQGMIDGAFFSGTKARVYEFDGRGNRVSMVTTGRGLFSEYHNYTTVYEYNLLNQLLTEVRTVRDGANSGQVETTVYTYDANGNQLTRVTTGYTPSTLDALFGRMVLGTMFGRHSRPRTEVTEYNAWNQIVRTENENFVTYYTYRADGLRHSKTMSGRGISGSQTVVHIWDGSQIIAEMQGSDPNNMAVVNRFIRGLGGRLIRSQQHGWYLHNARGDVTQRISDIDGREVLHAYWFSAFGVELNQDRDNHNPFRFNGEYYDFTTGRQYLRARSYDASTGRFVSPDPHWNIRNMQDDIWAILQAGNLYVFCVNNPIMWIDPSGLEIVLASNATDAQRVQYERAIEHLKQSETFRELYYELQNSGVIITIAFTNMNDMWYDPNTRTIYWNARSGLLLPCGAVQSAALGLAHEMGHAQLHIEGHISYTYETALNIALEEVENLLRFEIPIALELGEPIRRLHWVGTPHRMNNSTHFITVHTRQWFNPRRWFGSSTYTREHNRN